MSKTKRLANLLKRLNSGEDPAAVKQEAKEFLATVDPTDLSLAEQELLAEGVSAEDLHRLCPAHIEAVADRLEGRTANLKPGHVIGTLVSEHEMILGFLDELEQTNRSIQKADRFDASAEEYGKLVHLAEHLVGAEKHHQREEEVLFPEIERQGVFGPTQVMRMEHDELRPRKERLRTLAASAGSADFAAFKKELNDLASFIVPVLREHIFKENNILYPTALDVIADEKTWDTMKAECDKIGYCCFTPKA